MESTERSTVDRGCPKWMRLTCPCTASAWRTRCTLRPPQGGARVDSGSSCSRPCSSSPGLLGDWKRETLCYSRACELRRAPLSLSTDTGTKNKGRETVARERSDSIQKLASVRRNKQLKRKCRADGKNCRPSSHRTNKPLATQTNLNRLCYRKQLITLIINFFLSTWYINRKLLSLSIS